MSHTVLSDPVIRPVSVRSGKCTTSMVANKDRVKLNYPITRCYLETDKSWIDYSSLTKIDLSAYIDGLCNDLITFEKPKGTTLPGLEVIKLFSCSTQLSMNFFLLINVKIPTIVGILTRMSGKNSIHSVSVPK